jgi:hypothetical protein
LDQGIMTAAGPPWHLFEFMDQAWLPRSLRATLRDILECGNGRPFRRYYDWVVGETLRFAAIHQLSTIVELGAGTAPITRRLAEDAGSVGKTLVVCDLNPDDVLYEELERKYPGRVAALRESVDFSMPRRWPEGTLLVLSATLHHIPSHQRPAVLAALLRSADAVLIFEPLRKTLTSAAFVLLALVPALLVPALHLHRPGRWRRIFWCWLLPVAPWMFLWDGLVSCWRQWTCAHWMQAIRDVHPTAASTLKLHQTLFCQMVAIAARSQSGDENRALAM